MKYVLVTGAFGGMGKAVVNLLVKKGFKVIAIDKNVEPSTENIISIKTDLTSSSDVDNAFLTVKNTVNDKIFAIIHLAGTYTLNSLVEMDEEEFVKTFNVNLFSVFRVNKTFLPLLQDKGRIIITTSELAPLSPLPFTGLYAVSKKALDAYAYSLAMELQLLKINVSVLRPGAVKTDMLNVSTKKLSDFCENTKLYSCNARRFKKIVDGVESKHVSAEILAKKIGKIIDCKRPKLIYKLNRNPLLIIFNRLPKKLQLRIIKKILS